MKKQRTLMAILIGLLLTALLISGCQSILVTRDGEKPGGEIETRQFDFTEFSRLEIGDAFDYEIKQSDTYSISITANDNLFDDIEVTKDEQTLKIGMKFTGIPWAIFTISSSPKAVITMPQLYSLNSSGATHGTITNFCSTENFEIELSGASQLKLTKISAGDIYFKISGACDVTGDIAAEDIEFEVSGASSVQLEGSGGDMVIDASGASHLRLDDFTVNNADVTLSGASKGTINLDGGLLDTELSGASTLEYIGEPTLGKKDITGASTLKKK